MYNYFINLFNGLLDFCQLNLLINLFPQTQFILNTLSTLAPCYMGRSFGLKK